MALYPFTTATLTSLTAAGTTNSIKVNAQAVTFQVTVSGIGTNVVIKLEGSLDDTNFFNLDENETDTTITANGTRGFALNGCPVEYVRLRLVSFTGGTPTVASKVGAA
jgi:hypothetical protein